MLLACFVVLLGVLQAVTAFNVGVGIYDMTGPSVEINFMGYAVPGQRGTGIHQRLRARAFAFEDEDRKHVAFVSVDGGMGSDLVKQKVLEKLDTLLGQGVYTYDNLAISGTHTHGGPAGFLQYALFQITSFGFVQETFDAWVNGITNAIVNAHNNLQPAKILINNGMLYDSNINRSPTSYLLNPQEERDQYPEGDTDKNMMLLNFVAQKTGKQMGVLNWFAVHGTSMNNTNTLVTGDNKGYASYSLERDINGANTLPGMGPFVAAFASTNLGDVSPNTAGPRCIDTGLACDGSHSSCNGRCEKCIAFGPGTNGDMFESTQIIGNKQYEFAKQLMSTATETLSGNVDFRHSFVDMSKLNVTLANGQTVTTCNPAMGYSFAAGTTDGPGMFNFIQGTTSENPFWNKVRDFLSKPTEEEKACQAPKPILLNTADIAVPYEWDPHLIPVQILRVGNLFILSAPSEFTTMAGRRLRNAVRKILEDGNIVPAGQKIYVTIAGLTNTYSSYTVTYEEYQAQRYEAASTIFGPHTLEGYIQEFSRLATDMVAGRPSTTNDAPPDLLDEQVQLIRDPFYDRVPEGKSFGDVLVDAKSSYAVGETVSVQFQGANPRNDQRVQGSYLTVEYQTTVGGKTINKTVYTDGDWSTQFHWAIGSHHPKDVEVRRESTVLLKWTINSDALEGQYRICYHGDHKTAKGARVVPFTGCSSFFDVHA